MSLIPVVTVDDPNALIRGWGEDDSPKKPEAKNLVTMSLKWWPNENKLPKGNIKSSISKETVLDL